MQNQLRIEYTNICKLFGSLAYDTMTNVNHNFNETIKYAESVNF